MEDQYRNPIWEGEPLVEPQDTILTGEGEPSGEPPDSKKTTGKTELLPAALEFLHRLREPEPFPEGVISSGESSAVPDLYTLLEAMIALRQEISLQGRSFHRLEQTLQQSFSTLDFLPSLEERFSSFHTGLECLQSLVESIKSQTLADERNLGTAILMKISEMLYD